MNYFTSGLKSVLGAQQATEQPSGAETVERLVERVLSSTLLEDRRDACRALKSLSRKYRVEVGAHGMSAFTYVLQTDFADCEIVGYALDALCNITSDENYEEEEWQDTNYKPVSNLGAQFTEIFIKQPDNVGLVLSFLEEYDFRVRWPAVKLLKSLLSSKPKEVQDIVLVSPMGVSKLMDLLSDSREVIRNDALLLLLQLTKGNANIQKIVAFENAFDRLFDVINDEGYADGDIVVEDCLHLMLNLLKNNVSNQNFFKEGSYIQRLAPMFNILSDEELDVGLTPQKVANIYAVLQIIRTLVSPANPGQATSSCQRALRAAGIVEKLCNILMAGGVPVDVLTETIITVAEVIRGNLSNQEYFASVMAPSTPPKEAIVVLLMSMVNERQPFFLRCAVLYCFQCFLYRNELGQTKLIQTLLPSTSEQATVSAGQLLCGGLFSHDVLSHWLSSVALSHALIENPAAKESMLRVLLTPVSGHTPLSLLHHVTLLLQQSNKVQSKLGLLILLATWLSHCPSAIRHFLSIDTSISYLTTQAGATEHDDNEELVQGLCAFIMGICTHFNDDSVPSFSKENLRQLINKRVGLEVFLDKLNEVSRHEQYSRAVKHPNIRVTSPNDLLLDHEFCKLFKALEGLVMKAVTISTTELTNGPSENIEQYKNLIREQDKRITELSMHYEALHAQNIQQAAKIQELTDQNLILKAQLSTSTAAAQVNNSEGVAHLVQEKDQIIAKLEEELKNLRLHSHLDNRPLSAAESQAVDSEVIYLKSQVQALQQTEKELAELRKDQEDLLELVADQEREIETLKTQLQTYEGKEDQKPTECLPMKIKHENELESEEEVHRPNEISETDPTNFGACPRPEFHQDHLSNLARSASPSVTPSPDFKTETPSLVTLPPATPQSTPTPPTQISNSSRSTPNIFSPVPLPSPKPPSTGPPSPGPVTVPLSALSTDTAETFSPLTDQTPVFETGSLLAPCPPIVPPEPQSTVSEATAPPSVYSVQSALTNTSQSVPAFQLNSSESNTQEGSSSAGSVFSPVSIAQPPPVSVFSPFSFSSSLPSGVTIFTPSLDTNETNDSVPPFSNVPPPPSANRLPSGMSIFTPTSNNQTEQSEALPPLNINQLSGVSLFSPPKDSSINNGPALPSTSLSSSGVSIFTPSSTAADHTELEAFPSSNGSLNEKPPGFSLFPSNSTDKVQEDTFAPSSIPPPPLKTPVSIFTPSEAKQSLSDAFGVSNSYSPQNLSSVSLFTSPSTETFSAPQNVSHSMASIFSPPSNSPQPSTVFTPVPQPATYPYQQSSFQQNPHPPPSAETSAALPPGSIFSFHSNNNDSSPFSSLFPTATPASKPVPPPTQTQSQQPGGLFSFMNPSSYFSAQTPAPPPQATSVYSAQNSVMSNNLFQS